MSVRLRVHRKSGEKVKLSIENRGSSLENVFLASNHFKPMEIGSLSRGENRQLPTLRLRARDDNITQRNIYLYLVQFRESGPRTVSNVLMVDGSGGSADLVEAIYLTFTYLRTNKDFSRGPLGYNVVDMNLFNNTGKVITEFIMEIPTESNGFEAALGKSYPILASGPTHAPGYGATTLLSDRGATIQPGDNLIETYYFEHLQVSNRDQPWPISWPMPWSHSDPNMVYYPLNFTATAKTEDGNSPLIFATAYPYGKR